MCPTGGSKTGAWKNKVLTQEGFSTWAKYSDSMVYQIYISKKSQSR